MGDKLEFLRKYRDDVRLVSIDEIISEDILLPKVWIEIFEISDTQHRINKVLVEWKQNVGNLLRNTISYLEEHLYDIDLMESNGDYSELYTIKNSKGEFLYYEGRPPLDDFYNDELEEVWEKIPFTLQKFYQKLHNGFFDYISESMGLVPLESVTYLGDDDLEWGIIEELEEPIKINLESSFGFFTNGMGSYVAIDYTNCNNDNAAFWSAKRQPRYNINFWNYVDEWIVIGFE